MADHDEDPTASGAPEDYEMEDDAYMLFRVDNDRVAPMTAQVTIDGAQLEMEVDTGAGISLISEAT